MLCASYEAAHSIKFGSADPLLGDARTAPLPDGGSIGVSGPLRDTEEPVVRPYWLVDDIDAALAAPSKQGALVAHPPLEIPGKGYVRDLHPGRCVSRVVAMMISGLTNRSSRPPSVAAEPHC
jgi:hypothetical protein